MKAHVAMLMMLVAAACQSSRDQPVQQPAPPPVQTFPTPSGSLSFYVLPVQYAGLNMPCVGDFGAPCQTSGEAKIAQAQLARTAVAELKKRGFADVILVTETTQFPAKAHLRLSINLTDPLVRASGGADYGLVGIYPTPTGSTPPSFDCRMVGSVAKYAAGSPVSKNISVRSKEGVERCLKQFFDSAAAESQTL